MNMNQKVKITHERYEGMIGYVISIPINHKSHTYVIKLDSGQCLALDSRTDFDVLPDDPPKVINL